MKHFLSKVKKSCKRFMTGKSGFSLVELIVVIAIMAVMAAVLVPALLGYVERSRAQKDISAMGEVTNAIQLSLADMDVYDEALQFAVKDNYSCYADGDTSTNTDANKTTTKEPDLWLFNDQARLLDEAVYKPAGKMRGVTVTLKPNGSAEYILKDGIVNKIGDDTTKKGSLAGKTLADCPELYNRLRSTVGDTIKVSSQTYRNSDYTIFVSIGTTGGNQADKQDAIKVYGQYNGTNLAEVAAPVAGAGQGAPAGGSGGSEQPGGGGAPDVTLPAKGKTLEDYTWAEVQQIVQAGKATEYGFTVGATKTLTYNSNNYTVRIIGLDQDGTNTATFMFTGSIGNHVMNNKRTNNGGFAASNMNSWLNSTAYGLLGDDVKSAITPVTKTNNLGCENPTGTSSSSCKLFLLSVEEVGLKEELNGWGSYRYMDSIDAESTSTYTYFQTSGQSRRQEISNNTNYNWWWLRSANSDDDYGFFSVDDYGDLNLSGADIDIDVVPAFVIG
jgi:prepilin-type N-terminal cleavage/methylation domain-containing protein